MRVHKAFEALVLSNRVKMGIFLYEFGIIESLFQGNLQGVQSGVRLFADEVLLGFQVINSGVFRGETPGSLQRNFCLGMTARFH